MRIDPVSTSEHTVKHPQATGRSSVLIEPRRTSPSAEVRQPMQAPYPPLSVLFREMDAHEFEAHA